MKFFWKCILLLILQHQGFAQTDSTVKKSIDTIRIGNITILRTGSVDSTASIRKIKDTIKIGGSLVIISEGIDGALEKIQIGSGVLKNSIESLKTLGSLVKKKPKKYSTNWFVWDLGFAGYNDQTDYSSVATQQFLIPAMGNTFLMTPALAKKDFALRSTRVSNFNLWFFIQRMSLIKQVVNLKYGLGIESNNYFFKTGIKYEDQTYETLVSRTSGTVNKNKLFANYLTAPLMININTNPSNHRRGFQLSAGVSVGYLISARQKMQIDKERSKVKSEFNLSPWKLSYIGELGLGAVRLYASYAPRAMHQYGVDQRPYTVGMRFSY